MPFDLQSLTDLSKIQWYYWLAAAAVMLIIHFIVAGIMGGITRDKGYSRSKGFHLAFWLGMVGYIAVAALPDIKAQRNQEEIIKLLGELKKPEPAQPAPERERRSYVAETRREDGYSLPEI